MDTNAKQIILEQYFIHISQLSHNKAKELIEKENENNKAPLLWTSFLNLLGILATSEKNIYSLDFQASYTRKLFRKKDTLINIYNTLLSEFKKMQAVFSGTSSEEESLESFIIQLVNQLHNLIQLRINIMIFYQQLFSQNGRNLAAIDSLNLIEISLKTSCSTINLLMPFKNLLVIESECAIYLLKTEIAIQHCNYLDSLLNLLTASSKLNSWQSMRLTNENRILALRSSKSISLELIDWMNKFKVLLLSKFNLYFYNTLSAQSNQNEVKSLLSNNQYDFYSRIINIQKKLDAHIIALIYHNSNTNAPELTYKLPNSQSSSNQIDCFFSYPSDRHEKYLNIIKLSFSEKIMELKTSEKIITSIDESHQLLILLNLIDENISIVLVLSKKIKLDTFNTSLITNFTSDLRCNKLYLLFKSK